MGERPEASIAEPEWRDADGPPALREREAHVWQLPLEASEDRLQQWLQILAGDEQQQAVRFVRPELTRRFVMRRALLRRLLGMYASVRPERVELPCNNFGKPYLAPAQNPDHLHFNLSQSQEGAVVIVARDTEVGIDVERIRAISDFEQLSHRFFLESEQRAIASHAPELRLRAFFRIWTGKEAILKACGIGIARGLHRAQIGLSPAGSYLAELDPEFGVADRWQLIAFQPCPDYLATVAVPQSVTALRYLRLRPQPQ